MLVSKVFWVTLAPSQRCRMTSTLPDERAFERYAVGQDAIWSFHSFSFEGTPAIDKDRHTELPTIPMSYERPIREGVDITFVLALMDSLERAKRASLVFIEWLEKMLAKKESVPRSKMEKVARET